MKKDTKQILQELGIHRLRELSREAGDSDIDVYMTVNDRDIIIKVTKNRAAICQDIDGRWHIIETIEM